MTSSSFSYSTTTTILPMHKRPFHPSERNQTQPNPPPHTLLLHPPFLQTNVPRTPQRRNAPNHIRRAQQVLLVRLRFQFRHVGLLARHVDDETLRSAELEFHSRGESDAGADGELEAEVVRLIGIVGDGFDFPPYDSSGVGGGIEDVAHGHVAGGGSEVHE